MTVQLVVTILSVVNKCNGLSGDLWDKDWFSCIILTLKFFFGGDNFLKNKIDA